MVCPLRKPEPNCLTQVMPHTHRCDCKQYIGVTPLPEKRSRYTADDGIGYTCGRCGRKVIKIFESCICEGGTDGERAGSKSEDAPSLGRCKIEDWLDTELWNFVHATALDLNIQADFAKGKDVLHRSMAGACKAYAASLLDELDHFAKQNLEWANCAERWKKATESAESELRRLQEAQRWIPVEEKLPEGHSGHSLVVVEKAEGRLSSKDFWYRGFRRRRGRLSACPCRSPRSRSASASRS